MVALGTLLKLPLTPLGTAYSQVPGAKKVIEKVKTGQLHMAAITAVGLGKIVSDALVFQVPGLFSTPAKMDKARKAVAGELSAKAEAEGFKLLGWSDVGPNYYFTNNPVTKPSDLKAAKMWVWTDDPIAQSIVRNAGGLLLADCAQSAGKTFERGANAPWLLSK